VTSRLKIGVAPILFKVVAPVCALPRAESHCFIGSGEPGVSEARLARIRHGINTSHRVSQVAKGGGYTKRHFDTRTTAAGIALIKLMAFDHIRFLI
jgi:hypothetical protein